MSKTRGAKSARTIITPAMALDILTATLRECSQAGLKVALTDGAPGSVAFVIHGAQLVQKGGGVAIEPAASVVAQEASNGN